MVHFSARHVTDDTGGYPTLWDLFLNPSGYVKIATENGPSKLWIFPVTVVIFHSHIKLTEGISLTGSFERPEHGGPIGQMMANKQTSRSSNKSYSTFPHPFPHPLPFPHPFFPFISSWNSRVVPPIFLQGRTGSLGPLFDGGDVGLAGTGCRWRMELMWKTIGKP